MDAYNVGEEGSIEYICSNVLISKEKNNKTTQVKMSKMYSTRQGHSQNWIQVILLTDFCHKQMFNVGWNVK